MNDKGIVSTLTSKKKKKKGSQYKGQRLLTNDGRKNVQALD